MKTSFWRALVILTLLVWGAFLVWFLLKRWTYIGLGATVGVLAVALVPAWLSSMIYLGVSRIHFSGRAIRFLQALTSSVLGAASWYLLTVWICSLIVALAVHFNFPERVNNPIQFFYTHDGHFFIVAFAMVLFSLLPQVRPKAKIS